MLDNFLEYKPIGNIILANWEDHPLLNRKNLHVSGSMLLMETREFPPPVAKMKSGILPKDFRWNLQRRFARQQQRRFGTEVLLFHSCEVERQRLVWCRDPRPKRYMLIVDGKSLCITGDVYETHSKQLKL